MTIEDCIQLLLALAHDFIEMVVQTPLDNDIVILRLIAEQNENGNSMIERRPVANRKPGITNTLVHQRLLVLTAGNLEGAGCRFMQTNMKNQLLGSHVQTAFARIAGTMVPAISVECHEDRPGQLLPCLRVTEKARIRGMA